MTVKLSDYVFQFIAGQGVKHVFMLPGGGAMHLNDSLGTRPDIEYVCTLHEQAAAIAADAYARVTNNLGVALVTTGPGGTNAVTGVAGAWLDSTPCLFISGQVKRADMKGTLGVRQLGVQEVDIVSIMKPITKYAVTVMDPATIKYHLEKAVYLARSGRPGPVWIDIPLDVQASMIDPAIITGFDQKEEETKALPVSHDVLEKLLGQVIESFNHSDRPIALFGNGVRLAGAQEYLLELIDCLGIPVLTTWMGLDLIPGDHDLLIGRPGSIAPRGANFALQNSDWLLMLGTRLDMAMIGYAPDKFARAAKKIMVDIDVNEIRKFKTIIDMPICSDAKDFILEFLKQNKQLTRKDRTAWILKCKEWKKKYPVVLLEHRKGTESLSTYFFSEVLADELVGGDIIVPGSSGVGVEIFFQVFTAKSGQRVFHARGLGAMGYALPSSIGACLASGRKRTISVDGDGGFQLNIQELETVARLQLPIKYFIINNQGYASILASQQRYFGRLVGADATSGTTFPNIVKIASAYGITTVQIEGSTNVRQKITKTLQTPGPVICNVIVRPNEICAPRLSSMQRPDGSMVSKPLEDLWPFMDRQEFYSNMMIPPLDE